MTMKKPNYLTGSQLTSSRTASWSTALPKSKRATHISLINNGAESYRCWPLEYQEGPESRAVPCSRFPIQEEKGP